MDANLTRVFALVVGALVLSAIGTAFVRSANVGPLKALAPGTIASLLLRWLAAVTASLAGTYTLYTLTHDLTATLATAAVTGALCGVLFLRGSSTSPWGDDISRQSKFALGACWIVQIFNAFVLYARRDEMHGISSALPMLIFSIFLLAPRIGAFFRPGRTPRQAAP